MPILILAPDTPCPVSIVPGAIALVVLSPHIFTISQPIKCQERREIYTVLIVLLWLKGILSLSHLNSLGYSQTMKSRQPFLSTLQPKVLAAVGGTCLVLFLGQLGVARSIIMRGYANLELEQAQTNAERLERSFARDIENLMAMIRDWAVWDDTYQFVQTGDEAYIKSNLTSDTFMSLSLNLIAIFDDDGNLIYGQVSDVDAASQTDIPPELLAAITQHPDLLNRSLASPHISGFVRLNQIQWCWSATPF